MLGGLMADRLWKASGDLEQDIACVLETYGASEQVASDAADEIRGLLVPVEGVLIEGGDHDLEGDVSDAILLGFEEGGAPWTRRAAARVLALLRSRAVGGEETP
jgi:hypothetical protein